MERVHKYSQLNSMRLSLESNWEKFRFVCIDSESTGLDPRRDSLVSLAGVTVTEGDICLYDEFSIVMPVAYNTSSVTVHGITREAAAEGAHAEGWGRARSDPDLGPTLHRRTGVREPHLRDPQREDLPQGVRHRGHGRPQAGRVQPEPNVQGTRRVETEEVRRTIG